MIPQVLVPLAHGFEEIEATCPIDLLKRAEVEVVLASCETELEVCGRSGIIIRTDQFLMETKPDRFDLLVIPGGPAVFELRKNKAILSLIQEFADRQRPIAAICAHHYFSKMQDCCPINPLPVMDALLKNSHKSILNRRWSLIVKSLPHAGRAPRWNLVYPWWNCCAGPR